MKLIQIILIVCLLALAHTQNGNKFETIVIGGGMAGVAAAVEIAKTGQQVAILEANNYIGGRLKTTPVGLQAGGTLQFDEGASWIHGSSQENPITKLSASVQGLVMEQTDDGSSEAHEQDGSDASAAVDAAQTTYRGLLDDLASQPREISMASAFSALGGASVLSNKYFMFHVSNDMEFQTSASINQLAGNGNDDSQFDGRQMLILSGYQKFAQTLLKQADVKTYLSRRVKKVTWKGTESQILCENGEAFYARYVVIAVPLGVLKKKVIQFVPPLPSWKSDAIESLGFGNVCKIVVDFPDNTFTSSTNHYIGVVSNDVTKRGLASYFLNLKAIAGVNALMTFGLGSNSYDAENMSEADLKDFINDRLSAFVTGSVTASTFQITRTSWAANQNFFGTYAYSSVNTRPEHWTDMAKPVEDSNLYFCGEHTISKYRGTVHGAYLSGKSAAEDVKNKANKNKIIIIVVSVVGGVAIIVTIVLVVLKVKKGAAASAVGADAAADGAIIEPKSGVFQYNGQNSTAFVENISRAEKVA